LRHRYAEFQSVGLGILVVGLGTPARSKAFRQSVGAPFPILSDPRRESYRRYGLMRTDFRRELNPAMLTHGLKDTLRHGVRSSPDQDMLQLGGVFIVDGAGVIRYAHRARQMHDNPPVDELLAVGARLRAKQD
jgi:alkyl hydroperoxide reductase subunit AhpC